MAECAVNCLCCAKETTSDRRLLCSEASKDVLPTLLQFIHDEMCNTSDSPATLHDILQCTSCKHVCRTCFRLLVQYNKVHNKIKGNVSDVLQSGLVRTEDCSSTFPKIKRARVTIPHDDSLVNRKADSADLSLKYLFNRSHL